MSKYKNNRSASQARKIEDNREMNIPRLNLLKETFGCYMCGRCDVPGEYLDGHHFDKNFKYKPLAWLVGRNWRRVVTEILGLKRGQQHGGGPIVIACQRYHEDQHACGAEAKLCTHPQMADVPEPYRRHSRKPIRKHLYSKTKNLND